MPTQTLSVIIATKNEEKNIARCLNSIQHQKIDDLNIEVIIVDNNSGDKTREIAGNNTKNVYNLPEHVDLSNIQNFRGAQLNLGASLASGDVLFFPDADMTFDKDLLCEAMSKMEGFDALYVPEIVCGESFFGKIRRFERSFYNETCIDGVRFVKKEVFKKNGGFDANNILFGPDDWDFTKTLKCKGYRLSSTESVLYHHEEWLNLKLYLRKKSKYVDTFRDYVKKWGKSDLDVKKQLGIKYRYFGIFMENGKWMKLIRHPILTTGMYFLKFLVGVIFLLRKNF